MFGWVSNTLYLLPLVWCLIMIFPKACFYIFYKIWFINIITMMISDTASCPSSISISATTKQVKINILNSWCKERIIEFSFRIQITATSVNLTIYLILSISSNKLLTIMWQKCRTLCLKIFLPSWSNCWRLCESLGLTRFTSSESDSSNQ